ncbi:NRPS-like enzyme [Penicillium concentricum]|uniref:NRPS-like enzyme n=1 Tax=Penicillium concentricum TaxID=293559 RepID=A0A9W9SQS6_9EURO|nr:NRPS-like enzyme [Penicillium concentricum]KAJ5382865.1 NRPS-like enzyme [Penicillium concentricum]
MSEFNPENELLPQTVDHYARVKPDALYAEYPTSPMSYDDGYVPITYRTFANAINGIAWWLTKTLGPGQGDVLAYIGPNDLRYPALVIGAVKAGYCMFLTSPRNSVAAHESLLRSLNCTKVLATTPRSPPITNLLSVSMPLEVYEVPSVQELLANEYPHFEYRKTYPEDADTRFVAIHTSGSTGIPKPISWTFETTNRHMRMVALSPPEGFEEQHRWSQAKRMFLTLPPFHAGGLAVMLFIGVPAGMTIIVPTSGGLPTAAALVEARKQTPFEIALVVPSILHELAQQPDLLGYCSQHLEYLIYVGGDLPQEIGDTVVSKLKLVNQYAATEVGMLTSIHPVRRDPRQDWRYTQFHPELGVEMRPFTEDEYELVIVHTPERESHQMPSTIFPGRQEYSTRDLWVRHPDRSKSDLWRWSARADDVIVFLNGEKTNPVSMEQHVVVSNPEVSAVVVAGAQRFQASLIIEFGGDGDMGPSERAAAIEKIWPSIEEANRACPAHARIARTHILFTTPDKPIPRATKGTVQRAGTLALYAPELDALYANADQLAAREDSDNSGPGRVSDLQQVSDFIQRSLVDVTGWSEDQVSTAESFFAIGLDSLQTITAARRIKRGLDLPSFAPNLIYLNPSVSALAQATLRLIQDDAVTQEAGREAMLAERDDLLRHFTDMIDSAPPHTIAQSNAASQSQVVVLTGSTGTLGTYILNTLLKDPSVSHIHCLNRKKDSATIQQQKNTFYHLDSTLNPSKVTFWHADLTKPDLGLATESLQTLQKTATVIIHNAWNVNFNLPLSSFTPDLHGITNLMNITITSPNNPHLFFLSSISSVLGHTTPSQTTPENLITTTHPAPNGYANSKYIAEHLLSHGTQTRSINASFARVGQIAGAARSRGLWNRNEWFPSLVRSSLQVRALPETLGPTLGRVDWVPVDLLAEVLVDLALGDLDGDVRGERQSVSVFHPLNLYPEAWGVVAPVVAEMLSLVSGEEIGFVDLSAWVQRVRLDIEISEGELEGLLERNPAAKLLGFFEGVVAETGAGSGNVLDTRRTAEISKKLRDIQGVGSMPHWVQKWVGEWLRPLSD